MDDKEKLDAWQRWARETIIKYKISSSKDVWLWSDEIVRELITHWISCW